MTEDVTPKMFVAGIGWCKAVADRPMHVDQLTTENAENAFVNLRIHTIPLKEILPNDSL